MLVIVSGREVGMMTDLFQYLEREGICFGCKKVLEKECAFPCERCGDFFHNVCLAYHPHECIKKFRDCEQEEVVSSTSLTEIQHRQNILDLTLRVLAHSDDTDKINFLQQVVHVLLHMSTPSLDPTTRACLESILQQMEKKYHLAPFPVDA